MANDILNQLASPNKLPASLLKKLTPISTDVFGQYGFEGTKLLRFDAADMTEAERNEGIAWLSQALRPCPADVAGKALARLRATTKARREASTDDAILFDTLLDVLREYPADAVISACSEWRANNVFFPAEAELRKLLDAAVAERRAALRAFQTMPESCQNRAEIVPPRVTARQVDEILRRHGHRRDKLEATS